jgi:S-adenosylmethionine decarboxylase
MTFGPHLTLDLIGCPREILADLPLHFRYLKELPPLIDMTPITQPYVFPYEGLVPTDRGITGVIIIAESHISIHSFEEKGWCYIDLFSCRGFDTEKAIAITKEFFNPTECVARLVERGIGFPRG